MHARSCCLFVFSLLSNSFQASQARSLENNISVSVMLLSLTFVKISILLRNIREIWVHYERNIGQNWEHLGSNINLATLTNDPDPPSLKP